jgi:hypothetical protein
MTVAFHLVCVCKHVIFAPCMVRQNSSGLLQGSERMWQEADKANEAGNTV